MMKIHEDRGISQVVSALILITIATVGGAFVYTILISRAGPLTSSVDFQVQTADVFASATGGLLSISIKNTGSVNIPSFRCTLRGGTVEQGGDITPDIYSHSDYYFDYGDVIKCDWVILNTPDLSVVSTLSFTINHNYWAWEGDVRAFINSPSDTSPGDGEQFFQGTYNGGDTVEIEVSPHVTLVGLSGTCWWLEFTKPVLTWGGVGASESITEISGATPGKIASTSEWITAMTVEAGNTYPLTIEALDASGATMKSVSFSVLARI